MSIEKVRAYFQGFGVADRIMEFPVSSATVELAAQALGVEGARIAKSMSFKIGEDPIIIVMAGDARVDNSKYKAQFHTKAKMLTHEEAHELIGHDVGGGLLSCQGAESAVQMKVRPVDEFEHGLPPLIIFRSGTYSACQPLHTSTHSTKLEE